MIFRVLSTQLNYLPYSTLYSIHWTAIMNGSNSGDSSQHMFAIDNYAESIRIGIKAFPKVCIPDQNIFVAHLEMQMHLGV